MKTDYQIAIIGAGFSGIVAALRFKKEGKNDFVILEKNAEIGGTWRDNIYPGCACDVPSILYSIANQPNPNWSEMYSPHHEILDYMKNVIAKNDLNQHIRYNFDAFLCEFIENGGYWKISDKQGNTLTAKLIIWATGPLNRPIKPNIKGLDIFKGKIIHTGEWDNQYDLRGKKVAVVGTGASAIQLIPAIADKIAEMTVFQRNAAWIDDRNNRIISNFEKKLFTYFPIIQQLSREILYWAVEFRGSFFVGNKWAHKYMVWRCLRKLKREVPDENIRKKLTPTYKLGCKRVLTADDFYPVFSRKNVHLVTEKIIEITENEIITEDNKKCAIDTLILATGFSASEVRTDKKVIGLNGRELFNEWLKTYMQAYKGTCASGYPNFLFVLGPNTGLGHSSMIHIMESQMNYIMQYIEALEKKGENTYLEVKASVQEAHNQHLKELFQDTVWASGCNSWYLNSQGVNTTLYPRLTLHFRKNMKKFDITDFE